MAVNIYTEKDADMSFLEGKTVGMIGYGSQGHAHALNLHDSGVKVMVGLYEGSASRQVARDAGLEVGSVAEVAQAADVMMVAIPDHVQKDVYRDEIEPNLGPGKALMFAHGFTIHYQFRGAAAVGGRDDGGAQGAGPPDAGALRGAGHRRTVPAGHSPGRHGQRQEHRAGLCVGHRLRPGRGAGDDVQGRDGERPVRRAVGAVRRRDRADQPGVRGRWWSVAIRRKSRTSSACTS